MHDHHETTAAGFKVLLDIVAVATFAGAWLLSILPTAGLAVTVTWGSMRIWETLMRWFGRHPFGRRLAVVPLKPDED